MSRRRSLVLVACALALLPARFAGGAAPTPDRPERANRELAEAAREYRASLEHLQPFRDEAVARAREQLEARRQQLEAGLVARRDVEEAERALAVAEAAAAQTRKELAHADLVITEALAAAMLPPAAPGTMVSAGQLIRFHSRSAFSLARLDSIERFFAGRFGRALPVSALGQTAVHDRLGFDHRNALDVAVRPDSAEGRVLLEWLRTHDVPFLAFRGPVAGESTGAHVHIGEPSPRTASGPRS